MSIALFNLILNAILVGVILITQFVSYPLLKKIEFNFESFHKNYVSRIGPIVAPIMILELIMVFLLCIQDYENIICLIVTLFTILIWVSTFLIQVPIHNRLSKTKKSKQIRMLINSNIIRTILWTLKLFFSIKLL